MRQVGIYARVSKAEADDPTSVPVQLADCRERALEEGWEVVAEYADEGISAWNPKKRRPAYERLLQDLEVGRVDTILVRETERLLRSQKDAVRLADLADSGRLKLVACTLESDIDFRRARDRKDFRDRASSAQFYSDFLSEKMKRTKAHNRAEGEYTGGGPVFGYAKGPIVDPEEAALIHEAVRQLARGATLYWLAQGWNDVGVKTANGNRWNPTGMRRLLTGEHLTGGNGYPAILTDVEAAIVREKLAAPRGRTGRPSGRRYAVTKLVYCAECGTKLDAAAGTYRCTVSHGGCGRVSINAVPLEQYLLRAWVEHDLRTRRRPSRQKAAPSPDTTPILRELRKVERRIEEVTTALAEGTLTVTVAGPAARRLEEHRKALTEQLARALPPTQARGFTVVALDEDTVIVTSEEKVFGPEAGADFARRWNARELTGNEVEDLGDFLSVHVDRVAVKPRAKRGHAFDPSRVKIAWATSTSSASGRPLASSQPSSRPPRGSAASGAAGQRR